MSDIKRTAAAFIKIPLKGIVRACKIPPNADSLKAQSAVIFRTDILYLSLLTSEKI